MLRIRHILFPTDFSHCAEQSYSLAFDLACFHGATLHVLNVTSDPRPLHDEHLRIQSEKGLSNETVPNGRIDVVYAQRSNYDVGGAIRSYIQDQDIDLVVMSTHGRQGLDRLLNDSVAEAIVREAPCPVLTLRAADPPVPYAPIRHITVPVDFSEHTLNELAYAKALAATLGAHLSILHMVGEWALTSFDLNGSHSIESTDVYKRVDIWVKQQMPILPGGDVSYSIHLLVGQAMRDILRFAEQHKTDLVVVAPHGKKGITRLLLGSMTEQLVRDAPCPVLSVKRTGKSLLPPPFSATSTSEPAFAS